MYSLRLLKGQRFSKFALFPLHTIDNKICKGANVFQVTGSKDDDETSEKCGRYGASGKHNSSGSTLVGLSNLWVDGNSSSNGGGNYDKADTAKMGKIYIQVTYIYIIRRISMKVSNAINILNSSIDGKICKEQHNASSGGTGKCIHSAHSGKKKLSEWAALDNTGESSSYQSKEARVTAHDAGVISSDTSNNLTREEKGVVSSVFAKVIEGAEIPINSSIDTKICKDQGDTAKPAGKCENKSSGKNKLSEWTAAENAGHSGSSTYPTQEKRITAHDAGVISSDTANNHKKEKDEVSVMLLIFLIAVLIPRFVRIRVVTSARRLVMMVVL